MESYCRENGLPMKKLHPGVLELMKRYHWPGNVRELRNQVERMLIMARGRTIYPGDLSDEIKRARTEPSPASPSVAVSSGSERDDRSGVDSSGRDEAPELSDYLSLPFGDAKKSFEKRIILAALERSDWNVTRAAESLGLGRTNLHKKIARYGLSRDRQ
jgi:two-component system nitrogen regulation response regulator NtrX